MLRTPTEHAAHDEPDQGIATPGPAVSPLLAARLAQSILRPLCAAGTGDDAATGLGDLDARTLTAMRALAVHPGFNGPLNRAAAQLSGLGDIVFDAHDLLRVGRSQASDCALFLATAAPALLDQAALHLGAIALHRQLVGLALKRDREALQRLLGEDTYHVATREAPVLYSAFASLDDGSFTVTPAAIADERRMALAIAAVGRRVLHGFVAATEPTLTPLLAMRNGRQPAGAPMTDRHLTQIAKLLHRRYGPWSPITG